ncbi:hypothetical protein [Halosimplex sp. J119]
MSLSDRERTEGFQHLLPLAVATPSERAEGFQRPAHSAVAVPIADGEYTDEDRPSKESRRENSTTGK